MYFKYPDIMWLQMSFHLLTEEKKDLNIFADTDQKEPEKYDARQKVMGAHLSKNTDVTHLVGRTLGELSKKWAK